MGESDKPLTRYSTSDMAKDTLDVVNYLGWTSRRELHVIGVSMGGMIAQELVCRHALHSANIPKAYFQLARLCLSLTG